MDTSKRLSRREFLRLASIAAIGTGAAACVPAAAPTSAPAAPAAGGAAPAPTVAATVAAPAAGGARKVNVAVGGWAEQNMKDLLAQTDFTKNTGIDVQVVLRTDTKETELTRLASAVQSGTSPYDVIDFEDELTTTLSQAGYVIGLDDLLPADLWDDFSPEMINYSKTWSTYKGETFRVIHNWEMPYWWYRKDWFDAKGVAVPKTWDDVKALGKVFTDEGKGVWASEDGLIKGAFLNVYLAWVTLQAGGNPFEVGDPYKQALQYTYDLMYTGKALNPGFAAEGLQPAERRLYRRQGRLHAPVALLRRCGPQRRQQGLVHRRQGDRRPAAGRTGRQGGFHLPGWLGLRHRQDVPQSRTKPRSCSSSSIAKDTAVTAMKIGFWFLNARKSVLAAAPQDNWLVKQLKMYTDAGVIGVRPFHPRFVEALTMLEDTAAAYLTKQISLEESMDQAKDQLAKLS